LELYGRNLRDSRYEHFILMVIKFTYIAVKKAIDKS